MGTLWFLQGGATKCVLGWSISSISRVYAGHISNREGFETSLEVGRYHLVVVVSQAPEKPFTLVKEIQN